MNEQPRPAESLVDHLVALLVDRDDVTRHLYAEYLKLTKWEVEEAVDGREALAKAIATRPNVIVTETRLPGMSGYDLCDLLRHDASTGAIPIVVVTADAFANDLARARAAGADAVLAKPCLPQTLAAELRKVLERASALHARAGVVREAVGEQLARAQSALQRSLEPARRRSLKRALNRGDTTTPPQPPPALVCPECDRALVYERSHVGGVSAKHQEQWDYFDCPGGCGTFQYRTRTRKLRQV